MSSTTNDSGKKWIQAVVAVLCIIVGYVFISFFGQLAEWFDLESKISNYNLISNVISVLIAGSVYFYVMGNEKTSAFLNEVYAEAMKVVWPDKNETVKHTIIIMIGVTIVGFILWIFDYLGTLFLSLIQEFVK